MTSPIQQQRLLTNPLAITAIRCAACGILLTAIMAAPATAADSEETTAEQPSGIRIIPLGTRLETASDDSGEGPVIIPGPTAANPFTRSAKAETPPRRDQPDAESSKEAVQLDKDLWKRYREIYQSIPFNRAEYEANPSYRHEATMEILLGKPRPKIVPPAPKPARRKAPGRAHLGGPPVNHVAPYEALSPYIRVSPHRPFQVYDFSRGPYSRYQGLFGYRGGYRSMYYLRGGYLNTAPR